MNHAEPDEPVSILRLLQLGFGVAMEEAPTAPITEVSISSLLAKI